MKSLILLFAFSAGPLLIADGPTTTDTINLTDTGPEQCTMIGIGGLPPCPDSDNQQTPGKANGGGAGSGGGVAQKCKSLCGIIVKSCVTGERFLTDGSKFCFVTCYYEGGQRVVTEVDCSLI